MTERPILFSAEAVEPLTWKQRNREAVNARRRELYAAEPDKHRERQRAYKKGEAKPKVLAASRAWNAEYRSRLRTEMLVAYGSCCKCCGERQPLFLQLDHVENDGHLDRKVHKTSNKLLAHLKREGWPQARHQLLCANCNFGKLMNGGTCPHHNNEANHA